MRKNNKKNNNINSKKGSLSLSMNAIVVVVLAFAMLGLGLTITNLIFGSITIPTVDLPKTPATSQNPIAIADKIIMKDGGTVELSFDFYNSEDGPAEDAKPVISECLDSTDALVTWNGANAIPTFATPKATVGTGSNNIFTGILSLAADATKNAMKVGDVYICSLEVREDGTNGPADLYASKTFFIEVTS